MWVGISEAIRLLLIFNYNLNIKYIFISFLMNKFINDNKYSNLLNINLLNTINNKYIFNQISNSNIDPFREWLSGIIDGDGCFLLNKKGYASLEITMQLRDVRCLNLIKQKYGGSLKIRANQNHVRYRLHHKSGLLKLIADINGLIRNPVRMIQLGKICEKYNLLFYYPKELIYNNGWLSGFFDTDGSVYFNLLSCQMFITAAQKNKPLLNSLSKIYGGSVYVSKGKEHFKWIVYRKKEVIKLLDYFKLYPPRSAKFSRIKLIPKYYELRNLGAHKATEKSILGKAWKQFLIKWESFDHK
jgi:hypothetical protein